MSDESRRSSLPAIFVTVAAVFAMVVGTLGWMLIRQDRDLAEQRGRTRLDGLALRLAEAFAARERSVGDVLSTWDPTAGSNPAAPVELLVRVTGDGIAVDPDSSVRYLPRSGNASHEPVVFEPIDRLEFRLRDLPEALRALGPLARSSSDEIRARAELRIARIYGRMGREEEALEAFRRLSEDVPVQIDHIPSSWLGRFGLCSLLERMERYEELAVETRRLEDAVRNGPPAVDRDTWLFYVNAVQSWLRMAGDSTTAVPAGDSGQHAPSDAVYELARLHDDWKRGLVPNRGMRSVAVADDTLLVQWEVDDGALIGAVIRPDAIEQALAESAGIDGAAVRWSIVGSDGRTALGRVGGESAIESVQTVRVVESTWVVRLAAGSDWIETPAERNRRVLLILSLVGAMTLIGLAGLTVARALRRELRFARMQTEFVSAVSHEFRTPLTAIRQVTELLLTGRVQSAERAQTYFGVLERQARRLDLLVERLLDFGRARSGQEAYELERTDPGDVARRAIETAAMEDADARRVRLTTEPTAPVHADPEMLVVAVANLIDNALKFSPAGAPVRVNVLAESEGAVISVRDEGVGIAREDLDRVFEPFVRIRSDGDAPVPGTGVGLALARRIVDGHHGRIRVESELGSGTTFSVVIPYHAERATS